MVVDGVERAGADGAAVTRVGTVLGGTWTLKKLIGCGGTAAVYEADSANGGSVAVKIMHDHLLTSYLQRQRFAAEVEALRLLDLPGVVKVLGVDLDSNTPYVVLELLRGATLAERMAEARSTLPVEDVLNITDRVLGVLASVHARGLVHRDLKPAHLFLTTEGALKLLDFGIARFTNRALSSVSTEPGTLLGTPAFMSPEQARGDVDRLDGRSDLWSLGATLFMLVSGEFVHPAPTGNEQIALTMTRPARSLAEVAPQLPAALVAVVDRALAYSPADRFSDAESMRRVVRYLRENWSAIAEANEADRDPRCVTLPMPSSSDLVVTLDLPHRRVPRIPWTATLAAGMVAIALASPSGRSADVRMNAGAKGASTGATLGQPVPVQVANTAAPTPSLATPPVRSLPPKRKPQVATAPPIIPPEPAPADDSTDPGGEKARRKALLDRRY